MRRIPAKGRNSFLVRPWAFALNPDFVLGGVTCKAIAAWFISNPVQLSIFADKGEFRVMALLLLKKDKYGL
jgi:hypothetical protein